jgi:hypothetical protein
MKIIFTVLICFALALNSIAGQNPILYSIESDIVDSTISKGKCIIEGNVSFSGIISVNALVANCSSATITTTDKYGKFSFEISDLDSCIYVFKSGFTEIIMDRHDFKSQHRMKINFFLNQNFIITTVDKPVIYVYSNESTSCKIELYPKSKLTFTYPVYKTNWEFTTGLNGQLKMDDRTYPYLFWEGETSELVYQQTGDEEGVCKLENAFQIQTDSSISFLEHQLNKFGLNAIEKTDFITFWGPRMIENKYALIQFICNEDYASKIAGLNMQPQPESSLRLFMLFTSLEKPSSRYQTTPPSYKGFTRNGLTLVEWGGSQINPPAVPNL